MMAFEVNDMPYVFDQNMLSLAEAIMIKKQTGLTVKAFNIGMAEMDPEALQAMVWLAKRRAGETARLMDIEFDVIAFANSIKNITPQGVPTDPTVSRPISVLNPDGSNNGTILSDVVLTTSGPSPTT